MSDIAETVKHGSPGRGDWKETLGRVGLVGKGVLYVVIGILAIQLALGGGSSAAADQNGAIEWVGSQPFGKFLLVALTAALFALAVWRLLDAAIGDPVEGEDPQHRAKFAVLGIFYLTLAVAAATATVANWTGSSGDSQGGGGNASKQKATGFVLDWPTGRWIVVAVGLVVIGFAVYEGEEARGGRRLRRPPRRG